MNVHIHIHDQNPFLIIIITMNSFPNLPLPLTFIFILFRILASPSPSTAYYLQISPSPSPALWSGTALTRSSTISPAPAPIHALAPVNEKCSSRCQDAAAYLTACLVFSQKQTADPKEAFLLVKNDGESPLKVNFTILQAKTTVSNWEIKISKHDTKKLNVSTILGGNRSIVLSAGNGKCVIGFGSPASDAIILGQFSLYTTHGTPIYLLSFTALILGVALACCKSRTSRHHGDGVPYHELEMGKADSISIDDVETKQEWDDDWGQTEAEAVQSPAVPNISASGLNSKSSDKDEWENNWNDENLFR